MVHFYKIMIVLWEWAGTIRENVQYLKHDDGGGGGGGGGDDKHCNHCF